VTPLIFLTLITLLLVLLGGHNPKQALLRVTVVALGALVYQLFFHRRGHQAAAGGSGKQ
jgi:hypothetical protein